MKFIKYCLDLIFPPTEKELFLQTLSPALLRFHCISAEKHYFSWIESIFSYKNKLIKDSIWGLKYEKNTYMAKLHATLLAEDLLALIEERQQYGSFFEPLLIPIPLSFEKRKTRGYNQCEVLINEIVKTGYFTSNSPCFDALIKVRDTESQAHTESRKERLQNISGSFSVQNTKRIYGKDIILIDDVTTTGATLSEARTILLQNGARNVLAVTVAH